MRGTIGPCLRKWQTYILVLLVVTGVILLLRHQTGQQAKETRQEVYSDLDRDVRTPRPVECSHDSESQSSQDDICKSALKSYYDGLAQNGSAWWFCPKIHDILWNCLKPLRQGKEPLPNFYIDNDVAASHQAYKTANVAFLHLPKCGGTSINDFVYAMAGGMRKTHDIRHCMDFFKLAYSMKSETSQRTFMVSKRVYGLHHFAPSNRPFLYFAWFRDPIDRFLSQFHFLRTFPNVNVDVIRSKNLTDFLQKTLNKQEHYFNNFFVRLLQFGSHRAIDDQFEPRDGACESYSKGAPEVTEEHFLTAKRNLEENIAYVGILEDFKSSQDMFCYMMGIECPEREIHKNANSKRPKDDISEFEVREIRRRNEWDLKLYEVALDIYSKQKQNYDSLLSK